MDDFSGKKVVVTGGAGFIGSHLVDRLLSFGAQVTVIDNCETGSRNNLPLENDSLTFVEKSILEVNLLEVFAGAAYVFHHAAIPSVPRTVEDPLGTHRVNVEGSLATLLAAEKAGVHRLVYASSSAVYGDAPELPKEEGMPIKPMSPYATHKAELELYGKLFSELYGLETVGLRYFNVFGPRQSPHSAYAAVIPAFIDMMRRGERPVIYGDGAATRDFVYISDVVEANLQAATAPVQSAEIMNIAIGSSTSLLDLVDTINEILQTSLVPVYEQSRAGDILHSYADISKARTLLDFSPNITFAEGLRQVIEWQQEQGLNT